MKPAPRYLRSYTPGPNEQVDMTDFVRTRVTHRREEAAQKKRAFGFNGANVTRLNQDWIRSPQSADSELRYALRNLRFRCRELERNNDWFRKLLSLFEDNVVSSTGIKLQMKIYDMVKDPQTKEMVRQLDSRSCEIIEAAWKEQCAPANYTVTRKLSDIAADKLVMRSIVRDGDVLERKVRGYKNKFKYAIQILEADYLDDFYSDSRTLPNGNQIRMGVEVDVWKCPVAYWMLVQHPGDFNYGYENISERIRVPADEILHPFVMERPEQSRGYPWAVAAMNRFNMLGGYEEAELVAARMAACKGVYYTTDRPQMGDVSGGYAGQTDSQYVPMESLEPGINETLPMGMKPMVVDLQHPNANFPAFSKQQLRAAASSCGVSYISLANDLEGVNYSSIRAGLLDERETYKGVQTFVIDDSKNPIFEDWLEWVLLGGLLGITLKPKDFDRLNQKQFKARRWDWVDPLKDINAAVTAIEAGLSTRSEVIGNKGGNYEDVMTELHYEAGFEAKLDLNFGAAQPSTQKPNFPDGGKDDPEENDDLKKTMDLQALLKGRKLRLGDQVDARMSPLEERVEKLVAALEKEAVERANLKHVEQPRHPESGKWVETEKKIETLLEKIQVMLANRSSQDHPISSAEAKALIDNSVRIISGPSRSWTENEISKDAEGLLRDFLVREDADGQWITISGNHILLKDGETPQQALDKLKESQSGAASSNGGSEGANPKTEGIPPSSKEWAESVRNNPKQSAAFDEFITGDYKTVNSNPNSPAAKEILKALESAPVVGSSEILHRGMEFSSAKQAANFVSMFADGKEVTLNRTLTSFSQSKAFAEKATKQHFGDSKVIMTFVNPKTAVDISALSPFEREREAVLKFGDKLKMVGSAKVEKKSSYLLGKKSYTVTRIKVTQS